MNPIIDESVNLKSNDEYYQGIRNMTITLRRIDFSHTDCNGGYIAYLKLIPALFIALQGRLMLHGAMSSSKFRKYVIRPLMMAGLLFLFLLQLIFKPLKWLYKVKRRYTGTYETGGAYGLRNQNVVKYVTFYLIGVPVLHFKANLKEKDWDYILKS